MTKYDKRDSLNPPWVLGIIPLVKNVRAEKQLGLREAIDFISRAFGFEPGDHNWRELRVWLQANDINLLKINGPHWETLIQVLKAKYSNVSVQGK